MQQTEVIVEHARCAQCRNPIRGRQKAVHLARADMDFHVDCWHGLHAHVQQVYVERIQEQGMVALIQPYHRDQMAAWLPEAAIDAAAEELSDALTAAPSPVVAEQVERAD
jgi:hypothetical protein